MLATLGLAALTFGFLQPDQGSGSPQVLIGIVVGVIALALFVGVERRSTHPMMPFSLFWIAHIHGDKYCLTFFLYAALRFAPFFFVLNLQRARVPARDRRIRVFAIRHPADDFVAHSGQVEQPHRCASAADHRSRDHGSRFFMLALPGVTGGANEYWVTYFPALESHWGSAWGSPSRRSPLPS